MAGNTFQTASRTIAAMADVASGLATKKQAAKTHGLTPSYSLNPKTLARTAQNPAISQILSFSALDISTTINQHTVTLREALAKMATQALIIIATHGAKLSEIDKEGRQRLADAHRALELCKSMGVFKQPSIAGAPGELMRPASEDQDAQQAPPDEWSSDWWQRGHERHAPKQTDRSKEAKADQLPDQDAPNAPEPSISKG